MHGYLKSIILDGKELLDHIRSNDEYRYEIDRYFRRLIPGSGPSQPQMAGDIFFKGNHTLDQRRHLFPRVEYYGAVTAGSEMVAVGNNHNFRRRGSTTNLAPAQPGQIGFAMGRISAAEDLTSVQNPLSMYSSVDVNLGQIGSVFGHPIDREAFFNETAVVPTGVGIVSSGGTLAQALGEEGHYIYLIRIATTGNATGATYWYQRAPYFAGAFYPGSTQGDNYSVGESLSERWDGALTSRGSLPLSGTSRPSFIPQNATPTPAAVPVEMNFPTEDARNNNTLSSMANRCFDGAADGGRIWMAIVDQIATDGGGTAALASRSRALWAWKRMTGETPNRFDAAAGAGGDATMPNFPALPIDVQFRDIRAGRGGFIYLACDGTDDDTSTTAGGGALIMIDTNPITGTGDTITQDTPTAGTARLDDAAASFPTNIVGRFIRITGATAPGNNGDFRITARNSATQLEFENDEAVTVTESFTWELLDTVVGVQDVFGTAVSGIYTQSGFLQEDVLAVTIDTGENRAAAGDDRVWVLHRNGLSFFDVTVATGAVSAVSTLNNAGGTFTALDANSIRGLGGFTPVGSGGVRNRHRPLLDHDTNGDIYFVTTQTGSTHQGGVNRLNKVVTDDSAAPGSMTHTWFSIDTVAEGGALGFIQMGTGVAAQDSIIGLKVQRRDHDDALSPTTGDPEPDSLWVSTGQGDNQASSCNVSEIPVDQFTAQNNPGRRYFGDTLSNTGTDNPWHIQVAPDGQVYTMSEFDNEMGFLASASTSTDFTRTRQTTTESVMLAGPGGAGSYTITMTNAFFDATNFAHLRKRLVIEGAGTPGNNGSFEITAIASSTVATIFIPNAGAANETASMTVRMTGTDFDSRTSIGSGDGTWTNFGTGLESFNAEMFCDDSGMAYAFDSRQGSSEPLWEINYNTFITWQRDTSNNVWYRSRVPHVEQVTTDGTARTAHTTSEVLDSGVEVDFANSGAGGDEFVINEYYSFSASIGLIKTTTQELTWNYDIFHEKTDLFRRGDEPDITLANHVARGGFINTGALTNVQTDNPFRDLGTPANSHTSLTNARQALLLANFQLRIPQDGNNNAETIAITGTPSTANGWQIGIDLGADTVTATLRFCFANDMGNAYIQNMQADVYSATAASLDLPAGGQIDWQSPRITYRSDQDHPNFLVTPGNFRNNNNDGFASVDHGVAIELDIAQAATDANLANPATNDAMRFWKIAFLRHTGSGALSIRHLVSVSAFDASGNLIGIGVNNKLSFAEDSNYLANLVTRAVFIQDDDATAGGNCDGTSTTITLLAGTFDTDIVQNDFFRELDSNGDVVQEVLIDSRDSGTQLTLQSALPFNFTNSAWEVVRNADIRPRDDEGGGEDQAEFPPTGALGEGQIFVCPVTGVIGYNDNDVTATRAFRVERVVKVKRSL